MSYVHPRFATPCDDLLTGYCMLVFRSTTRRTTELGRTRTLVKSAIIQIEATPCRQWYESHHVQSVSKTLATKVAAAAAAAAEGGRRSRQGSRATWCANSRQEIRTRRLARSWRPTLTEVGRMGLPRVGRSRLAEWMGIFLKGTSWGYILLQLTYILHSSSDGYPPHFYVRKLGAGKHK